MSVAPKRRTLARNHVFWRIFRQNTSCGLGCSELQEPKNGKREKLAEFKTFLMRKVTHARKRNPEHQKTVPVSLANLQT